MMSVTDMCGWSIEFLEMVNSIAGQRMQSDYNHDKEPRIAT